MADKNGLLLLFPLLLGACSSNDSLDYDDYSLYQYDVKDNYGLGYYEGFDYQDSYYKDNGGVFGHHLRVERNFNRP